MRFTISSDIPGRLSVRLGSFAFDEDEARGVAVRLLGVDGVQSVRAHEANGAVVVTYKSGARNRTRILNALKRLDRYSLPSLPADSIQVPHDLAASIEANRFALASARMVFWHIVRRIFLPPPVRAAFTVFQALRFIKKGLASIVRGHLTVDVLDASLEKLVTLRRLSQAVMGRIRGDYRFIVGFNTALIALGVAGVLPLPAAAFLHNGSTLAITAANTRPYLR